MSDRPKSLAVLIVVTTLLLVGSLDASAQVPGCVWKVYDAARGEPQTLLIDADATPPSAMRFDAGFHTAGKLLAQNGGLDFDGDGRTDPFRGIGRGGGVIQWQALLSGTPTAWTDMAADSVSIFTLSFGDFDGDGVTDVFRSVTATPPNTQWVFSSGGTSNYANLGGATTSANLRFGRFDSDAKTDVFGLVPTGTSKQYDFRYSSAGLGAFVTLSTNLVSNTSNLQFGDFNGSGQTDVFDGFDFGIDSSSWRYYPLGIPPTVALASPPVPLRDLQFGDFDGDGKTDPFATRTLPDGRLEWIYWAGGLGDPIVLNTVDGPVPILGEFAGDGRTDALVLECGAAPLLGLLPETDVTKVPASEFSHAIGDVNGDGRPDVIRTSTCQNVNSSGDCGKSIILVQVAFGDGHGGFPQATPLQTLFSTASTEFFRPDVVDVTGDGLTDLLWFDSPNSNQVDIYEAVAAGDGTFTERPKQTLTVPNGMSRALVDVNGDGRTDLVFTSVCQFRSGFDFRGCSNGNDNRVLAAIAGPDGSFALSSLQSLGATGWSGFRAFVGDVNGDGHGDLVFNSTCQKTNQADSTCTAGTANLVYVALGDGQGGFTLGPLQTDDSLFWDTFTFMGVLDLNGDGRDDLVWISRCSDPSTSCAAGADLLVRAGLANGDGTFTLPPRVDVGFGYWSNFAVLKRGDVDGDGRADVMLVDAGQGGMDSGGVYVLFSDGAGGFTPSGMQIMHGRGWNRSLDLSVADLNGDGKAEITWFDTRPVDHDRILVSGDVAALTAVTMTTTTTTSTTLPASSDCSALSGLARAHCYCAAPLAPAACAGATLPAKITTKFPKACSLLGTATSATGKKQKKLFGKTAGRFGALVHAASKKATKKLPAGCGDALRGVFGTMRDDVRAARQSVGR